MRELRNKGAEVLDRVQRGERVTITRNGRTVAELRPRPRPSAGPAELIARRKRLLRVDPEALRRDVNAVVDPTL